MKDNNQKKMIWHVACDESGVDGQPFYGFGSLWMSYQRRAELTRMVQDLRKKHGCSDELKWQKAHSKRNAAFYSNVIDVFFRHNWMAFHCIIVEKSKVEKSYHGGDYDLAMRKHFCKLIETKIGNVIQRWPHAECEFLIEVDPLPSRYKKADEEFHIIANHSLARKYGRKDIIKLVETKDSKTSEHIQLVDFLLGAVMCAYQRKATSPAKLAMAEKIASYLGWESLRHDTWPTERKFNIWLFFDKKKGPRDIETKEVNLRYKLPPLRKK
ncbi:DUF3800 domain-containing protein [Escherichia coli]|uniref:DUF3800 domain-containing protein n=1 Tax=Escherichia coli TaxID=562 RepID=UPI000D0E9F9B|nr:DUF3800 domain-containing protein [Escherichia coli]